MDERQGGNEGGSTRQWMKKKVGMKGQWMKKKGGMKGVEGAMDETQGGNEGGLEGAMDETQMKGARGGNG